MEIGKMDDFSLSDLAGSTAIILASCGGLITIILSSRCAIKCRLGFTDECNLCMCSRLPPPDPQDLESNSTPQPNNVEQQNNTNNNGESDEEIIPQIVVNNDTPTSVP